MYQLCSYSVNPGSSITIIYTELNCKIKFYSKSLFKLLVIQILNFFHFKCSTTCQDVFFISICNYLRAFECYRISKSVVLQYGGICSFIQIESVEVKIYLYLLSPFSNLEIACKPNLKMKRCNLLLPKIIFSRHSVLICYLNDIKTIRN